MTPQSSLELQGNFQTHPFAELCTEIRQAALSGSLRLTLGDKKSIVYFDQGHLVFAVSNSRAFRLPTFLAELGRLDGVTFPDDQSFANDLEFIQFLKAETRFTDKKIHEFLSEQIQAIVIYILEWETGDWLFSPLAKVRDDMRVQIDLAETFLQYARGLSEEKCVARFRSLSEVFSRVAEAVPQMALLPQEAFVLSRINDPAQKIQDITAISGLQESAAMATLYVLWIGGWLIRKEWNPAFSEFKIASIRYANLTLKKASEQQAKPAAVVKQPEPEAKPEPEIPVIEEISLEEYLERAEGTGSYYDILGIEPKAALPFVRQSYFMLAKMFHPDRFHREDPKTLRRVANAFTKLAQAHDTLKSADSRKAYDLKLKREKAEEESRPKSAASSAPAEPPQSERAAQEFEYGRNLLLEDDWEGATPFLARAVHFSPANADYQAFFGKALSYDETQRHKAESAMQQAIKLEPENPSFRLMLAEFFIRMKLQKRAEGELGRLLAMSPNNAEARKLLDSISQK